MFILAISPLALICASHFHIANDAFDRLCRIIPVTFGDLKCIPSVALCSKCVFVHINDALCNYKYVVSFPNELLCD